MAVTTRLTWLQEKILQNYLGGKQFSLLYKASVHKFSGQNLLQKCCHQGPTIALIYSEDNVIGAYVQESYQKGKNASIILFALKETEISECKKGPYVLFSLFYDTNSELQCGYNGGIQIHLPRKEIYMDSDIVNDLGLPQKPISFQECEVFRCEDLLDQRRIAEVTNLKMTLLSTIRTYKPYGDLVQQIRILLVGPSGAGKSSFINSVKSIFRGHVTHQVLVGSDTTGISKKYRTYSIKDGKDGSSLPFILCDCLGLSEEDEGLCMEDIFYVIKGHIPDRYQFNSMKPISSSHHNFIDAPLLKDRIHCVAFVFDANSVEHLSGEMIAKIKSVRREAIKCGVVHVALLTHVDCMDLITKGDLIDIYRCVPVKSKLEAVQRELGFALSNILVVSNYTSEWELDPVKDVLILSALNQMLRAADDFLEDLPPEETDAKSEQGIMKCEVK
ncbi:PREDICTED: interferon-induced protein 44 [Galeopterus variegatus]|uniref:Interferon-induced protein 44 n=1 Tax=Galeopterus variegatus TaxID=482537 RepID=A0ABM0RAM6_GALVR|nr:PREDICTED: interferon-induced protein 44 [Galeopterus variegatus]